MNPRTLKAPLPVIGFVAWSGTGKTTLLTKVIPALRARGIRPSVIKHAHHRFEIDHEGKDSYELRKAGAAQMLIGSRERWALMTETPGQEEADFNYLIAQLDPGLADLIIIEGLKWEPFPKVEVHRPSLGKPLMCTDNPYIVAVATDDPSAVPAGMKVLDINDPQAVAAFVIEFCGLEARAREIG